MPEELRIWIDMDNSPHVPFFLPLIREMEKLGCKVTITARDCSQTCGLLDKSGRNYFKIGRHYGKNLVLKMLGLIIRAFQLYRFGHDKKFAVATGHGSRSLILAASLLRIPMVNIFDYEFSKFGPFLNRLPAKQLVPYVIPDTVLNGAKRVVKYPGLKEDVYVGEFKPDSSIFYQLHIDPCKVIITLRPPATEAHYHQQNSEKVFTSVLEYLMYQENATVIILPRNRKQAKLIQKQIGNNQHNTIIPERVVNGLNLLWHSDVVISGGGTMNREAAALGVPVYSIFRGKVGAVDRFLAASGKLEFIKKREDIQQIRIEKSERRATYKRNQNLIDFLIKEIVIVANNQKENALV